MMNVKSLVKRAKDQGIQMLVFQMKPARRLFFTGSDADVPHAIGEQLAWAALRLAEVAGEDPKVVLQSILDLASFTAEKRIKEESKDMDPNERSMRDFIRSKMAEADSEEEEDEDSGLIDTEKADDETC